MSEINNVNSSNEVSKTYVKQMQQESAKNAAKTELAEKPPINTSAPADIVEISSQGKSLAAESSSTIDVSVVKIENTASNKTTETTSSNEENISTTDLYTMTEQELLNLVLAGSISRNEMNTELDRRNNNSVI